MCVAFSLFMCTYLVLNQCVGWLYAVVVGGVGVVRGERGRLRDRNRGRAGAAVGVGDRSDIRAGRQVHRHRRVLRGRGVPRRAVRRYAAGKRHLRRAIRTAVAGDGSGAGKRG